MTSTTADVEETMKRLMSHRGVEGIIIVNGDGIPIRTNLDQALTVQYASLITLLTAKAISFLKTVDPSDDLQFLRLRSLKHEVMVAPEGDFILIVVQKPVV